MVLEHEDPFRRFNKFFIDFPEDVDEDDDHQIV